MSIKQPPSRLAKPNEVLLTKGSVIERVHSRSYAGDAFNPGRGGPTRFAPIGDAAGATIPTLYAAETLEAAIYETVFNDIPVKANRKRVPKTLVTSRSHSQLQVLRNLNLVSLRKADLMKWRISRNDLITSSPKLYAATAEWAAAIHHQFPAIEGLVCTSNQCDPDSAYLFFGDRVASLDFKITASRDGLTDKSFLQDVRKAGWRGGIRITV